MKNWIKLSILSLSMLSFGVIACDLHGHSGFMPENDLRIPVGEKAMGGITEVQFNRVMDKMTSLYAGVVASTGRKFTIERRWTDATVNAYAHQNTTGVDTIVMFGGLARHPETTEDGMALVACHELGHHLGGAPRKSDPSTGALSWAANEGQADYWGTMKCLRHYFESDDNIAAVKSLNVPTDVVNKCQLIYKNDNEIASCERVAMAGLALGKLLNAVTQGKTPVSFTTPDQSVVAKTFDAHPQAQCRLDTYFQASLCDHGLSEAVSTTDANTGVCSVRNGDKVGNRPLCWYKP
ncbi:MAG: hypothetical protein PHY93_18975 [Bacteriovorax sp.]|nr:hypothetical protein [Bacteriovorax sp.]